MHDSRVILKGYEVEQDPVVTMADVFKLPPEKRLEALALLLATIRQKSREYVERTFAPEAPQPPR
ncbi:MAG TPA: hypothetical protein VFF73_28830 [Planctomycetota bacterium]|nr:hypothetical protein [Planctomycetota bacterium]